MKKLLFPLFTLVLNLQLFADNVMTTLLPGMSAEMKIHYDNTLIDVVGPALVHDQFAQKRPIPQGSGKRIEFRRFLSLAKAMVPLTEGVTPPGNTLTVVTIEADIAQYGDYVRLSDMLELTAIDDNIVQTTKALGKQAGETLDTVTRNAMHKGTNVSYAPSIVNGNEEEILSRKDLNMSCFITIDFVEQIVAKLKAANAPKIDGKYVAIVHPFVTYQLRRDPEWIKTHDYKPDTKLFTNEVGEWCGVRFVESSQAKIYCGKNLASDARNLRATAFSDDNTTITFTGGTVEPNSLVGRKILFTGVKYTVTANTTTTITVSEVISTPAEGQTIYPGEGGAEGLAVFGCLFLGDNAYGVTEVTGGGLEVILKQLGQGEDPLNQRSSVGWKATKTAKILIEEYIVRAECTCRYSDKIFEGN